MFLLGGGGHAIRLPNYLVDTRIFLLMLFGFAHRLWRTFVWPWSLLLLLRQLLQRAKGFAIVHLNPQNIILPMVVINVAGVLTKLDTGCGC